MYLKDLHISFALKAHLGLTIYLINRGMSFERLHHFVLTLESPREQSVFG